MTEEELNKLSMEAKLLLAGGKYWEKKGKRIYVSEIIKNVFDMDIDYYNTGNICSIYINGEKWSNCQGKKFLLAIEDNSYWDCEKKKFIGAIRNYDGMLEEAVDEYIIKHEKAKAEAQTENLDRSALIAQLEEILEKLLK